MTKTTRLHSAPLKIMEVIKGSLEKGREGTGCVLGIKWVGESV